jgi:hypothetical protein
MPSPNPFVETMTLSPNALSNVFVLRSGFDVGSMEPKTVVESGRCDGV